MLAARRCSRSLARTGCANRSAVVSCTKTQHRSFVSSSVILADKTEKSVEFVVPSEWDLAYLKKFDIPPPTPEQLAKALPPPMEVHGTVGVLATDLFQVASVYGVIDTINEELKSLLKLAKDTPAFVEFVESTGATKKEVRTIFEDVFKNATPVLKKFVARMVENGDFHRILKVAETYDELTRAHHKEIPATLTFAKVPAPERLEVLKQRIAFLYLPKGAKPIWTIQALPELGSGFVLTTPDASVDTTYAKKLVEFKAKLAGIKARIQAEQPRAVPVPGALGRGLTPAAFQQLAKEVNQLADMRKQKEESEYKANFVDWV